MGVVLNPVVTNFTIYTLTRPDKFGATNGMYGQALRVGSPIDPDDAASKSYVDSAVAAMGLGVGQLNGATFNMSALWQQSTAGVSATNDAFHLSYLGGDILTAVQPPLTILGGIKIVSVVSRTNVQVSVPTNGLATAPSLQFTHTLGPANWGWISATNWVSGTNFLLQFTMPFPDAGFVRPAIPSSLPGVVVLGSVLQCAPWTVSASTNSTFGQGAGLIRWDANYLYVSTGTNQWKRAALSAW